MDRYCLGLDFGTESVRALVVDAADGREAGTAVRPYPHGVVDDRLPGTGETLPPDWALQDPDDYLTCLEQVIPEALHTAGVSPEEVAGVGVDFTACTMVPCRSDGTPLSRDPAFRRRPHAWTKLWKHHGAAREADLINETAAARGERFLDRYGGRTSSEWLLAKAWELLRGDPEVYAAAERLVDAGDWLVWQLTGTLARSACQAGYKGLWSPEDGYPGTAFLTALDPRLAGTLPARLVGDVLPVGARAGAITEVAARRFGLAPRTPVAVAIIDAHAAVPAAGVDGPGTMLLILGTSGCHMVLGTEGRSFPGIAGVVRDGILPGWYGYEAGQPATGDILGWFTRTAFPAPYQAEAEARGLSPHQLLTEKAAALGPGECGLLALDWWNGNRSVLMDSELSGVLVGLTLDTRPQDVYRALVEGTAFGTRIILENFERNGVEVRGLAAAGGLAERNELLLQIYADVCGRPLRVVRSGQACALGAAILGAAAAGVHPDVPSAVRAMGGIGERSYQPDPEAHARYDELFAEWRRLHDHFGRGAEPVLKRLRRWRQG